MYTNFWHFLKLYAQKFTVYGVRYRWGNGALAHKFKLYNTFFYELILDQYISP